MNCCGKKRLQWQEKITHEAAQPVSPQPVVENPVQIRYNGTKAHLVEGAGTGYLYLFAPQEPVLIVDGRDAPLLLEVPEKFSLAK